MAIISGKDTNWTAKRGIVQNGLVLNLDAAVRSSYPETGTSWYDLSGYNNNGTLTNGPIYDRTNGGFIVFDGTDDYMSFNNTSIHKPNNVSLICWLKVPTSPAVDMSPFIGWDGGSFDAYRIRLKNAGTAFAQGIEFSTYNGSTTNYLLYNTTNFTPWYFVAGTCGLNGTELYINANLITTSSNTSVAYGGFGAQSLRVGEDQNIYCPGMLSNLLLYNRQLTQQEISQNYNATRKRFGL